VASEYALLAAGVVIIAGGATIAFRSNLLTAFANIGTQIMATADRIAGGAGDTGTPGTAAATGASDSARRRLDDDRVTPGPD
jgi:Flp pilus assembly pilin Flp